MNYYGAKELAGSFRTVRNNTVQIAEEIPEESYGFRPAEGCRTVGEMLVHIALGGRLQEQLNLVERRTSMEGFDYPGFRAGLLAEAAKLRTKAEIVALLKEEGEKFASAVESLTDDYLGESIAMPPGGVPPSRTRFDLLSSVKEHEMHHRGQLMLVERMLGVTPHLTREAEARWAAILARRSGN